MVFFFIGRVSFPLCIKLFFLYSFEFLFYPWLFYLINTVLRQLVPVGNLIPLSLSSSYESTTIPGMIYGNLSASVSVVHPGLTSTTLTPLFSFSLLHPLKLYSIAHGYTQMMPCLLPYSSIYDRFHSRWVLNIVRLIILNFKVGFSGIYRSYRIICFLNVTAFPKC